MSYGLTPRGEDELPPTTTAPPSEADRALRDEVYNAICICVDLYLKWFRTWKQRTNERTRIEQNRFELFDKLNTTYLFVTDGLRAEVVKIPTGTKYIFEAVGTTPFNTVICITEKVRPGNR